MQARVLNLRALTIASLLVLAHATGPAVAQHEIATHARQLESAVDQLGLASSSRGDSPEDGLTEREDAAEQQPTAPASPLSPEVAALREKVRQTLAIYHQLNLNTRDHNAWEMMHQVVAFGVDTNLRRGGPQGEQVNAVAYLCWNGACRGRRILEMRGDRVKGARGHGVQGHDGQFLAILAQSAVPADYPLYVNNKQYTIADLVETEKLLVRSGTELTFQLIGIAHYCDLDITWQNERGENWSIPRMLKEEIEAPVRRTSTCGGTHRLFAVAYPVRKLQRLGQPITGEFKRAQIHTQNYQQYALKLQNPDGSLSTEWFEGRGAAPDLNRRLKTTGHILEWLVFSIEDDQLDDPRVMKAVDYLAGILQEGRRRQWELGPLGHGLHALAIYEDRISNLMRSYGDPQPQEALPEVAVDHESAAHDATSLVVEGERFEGDDDKAAPTDRTAQRPRSTGRKPTVETSLPVQSVASEPHDSPRDLDGPILFIP